MADCGTDGRAEGVEDDLTGDEEEDAKGNVTEGPSVLQRPDDQQNLQSDVDDELHAVEQVQDGEEADRVGRAQARPRLERGQRHEEGYDKGGEGAQPHHPQGQGSAILVQLEADEPVDHEAGDHGGGEAVLDGDEVWVW